MPLDPQAKAMIDQLTALGGPQLHELPVEDARRQMAQMAAFQADPEEVGEVTNRTIEGSGGPIPVRIYKPIRRDGTLPMLVYFHGGGWVLGSLDTHEGTCRSLANSAGCLLISVDYRLAPEHKFPAGPEDCYAVTKWVVGNAELLDGDPTRVAVGGDSAGGNLTAVVAQMARDRGGPRLTYQLMVYPVTDGACDAPSYHDNAEGYFLTRDAMLWFWNHYVRGDEDRVNPYASPIRAEDLRGLPPGMVITAEYDPLRDEGEAYGRRLREAGVPIEIKRYDGMIHGFFSMGRFFTQGREAMSIAGRALRDAFGAVPR